MLATMKIIQLFMLIHLFHLSDAGNNSLPSCTQGQNYLLFNDSCVAAETTGSRPFCKNVTFFNDDNLFKNIHKILDDNVTICFPYTANFMRCQRWLFTEDEFEIENKSKNLILKTQKTNYTLGDYDLRNGDEGLEAIVCVTEMSSEQTEIMNTTAYIYSVAWIISIISLAIAFVLCIAVPGLTTYRVVMPCYVGSLLISYTILLFRGLGPIPSSILCYSYGIGLQFSFLAAFFWLNVIAFDLWRSVAIPVMNPGRLRLLAYLTYGWGCPLLFVGTAVAFDNSKDLQLMSSFRPRFEQDCWFHGTEARLAFFYGPISAILILNLMFFVLTLFVVRNKVTQGVEKNSSLWRLAIELAVIMGLCWIMEVVSWAVGGDVRYWYFTDVINALQGLFVLIVIARRPNVMLWIKKGVRRQRNSDDAEVGSTVSYIQTEKKSEKA